MHRIGTNGTYFSISFKVCVCVHFVMYSVNYLVWWLLKSRRRINTYFALPLQLPEKSESCICDSESFTVTIHTNSTSLQPVNVSPPERDVGVIELNVNLPGANCSAAYNISLTFSNSAGMSSFSNPITVGVPSGSELS